MVVSWRRLTVVVLGVVYFGGAAFLAGIVTERVRVDRERMAVVRAQEQRVREARARAIRIELDQAAARTAWAP
ncbi:MAG TPA: hypothetical protein VIE36_11665 [Methylomirabilota bacterium]|jgi:hypothetical protein